MICEKCNLEMEYFRKGSSCGWTCPKCGDGIVTSYQEPWSNDFVRYTVSLVAKPSPSTDMIKTVAKVSGINSVRAKYLLVNGGLLIEDSASKIIKLLSILSENNISYTVSPEFPYELSK